MSEARPPIVVIAGPTATGKTAAAVDIATRHGGELVGADSVQVYRGFDIGSAKPTAAELNGVAHHLLDVLDPDEGIDAVGYAKMADDVIEAIAARGRLPIVVGGTGLWLRALVRGLVDVPPVEPELRSRLEERATAEGSPALHRQLREVDPIAAEQIHPNDRVRIVRALEVYEQTGRPMGQLRAEHALGEPRYPAWMVVIDRDREELAQRIESRTRAMIEAGWAQEVRSLLERWGADVRAFGSVGYRDMLAHVREGVSLEETERRIVKATRIYARRQRTWFRSEPGIEWRASPEELGGPEGRARLERWLEGRGRVSMGG